VSINIPRDQKESSKQQAGSKNVVSIKPANMHKCTSEQRDIPDIDREANTFLTWAVPCALSLLMKYLLPSPMPYIAQLRETTATKDEEINLMKCNLLQLLLHAVDCRGKKVLIVSY